MNKLIKIFLITLFALAVSCSGGTTITGGDGGVYDNPDLEYGQFLLPKTSYTGYNFAKKEQTTTIQVVKNSDGTCNLKGKIVLVTPENFDASTEMLISKLMTGLELKAQPIVALLVLTKILCQQV